MIEHLISSLKSVARIFHKQAVDKVSEFVRVWHPFLVGNRHWIVHNCLSLPHHVPVVERKNTYQHLVQNYTYSPPIRCHIIPFAFEDLGSKVSGSTRYRVSNLVVMKDLCDAEIDYF